MNYIKYNGKRFRENLPERSITIFFISFVYPVSTGYLKRMDLLIRWANERFSKVNFVIPNNKTTSEEVVEEHLKYCNNLFLVEHEHQKFKKLYSLKDILYRLFTGRYPKFYSSIVLHQSLIDSFTCVMRDNRTDYFLNTRNNYGGLVHFLPKGIRTIFDTQDIFTDMHRKYGMYGKSKWYQKLSLGYRERGDFVKSESEILARYDKIIAISETDNQKYQSIVELKNKITKIESIGIDIQDSASVLEPIKEFDILIVASNFLATQKGLDWMINEVAPNFTKTISLCVVGSIGDYFNSKKYSQSNLEITIKGIVDSVENYYNISKIVPICMLEGTGTSVKGIEALAFGAAIVTTSAGVRFGGLESGKHCLIADDSKTFAYYIELLLDNEQLRHDLGRSALEYAKSEFSLESTYKQLDSVFEF